MNRGSTARQPLILFPHAVYIGFRLLVLLGKRSGHVASVPWSVLETLVALVNNSVGTQSCLSPPRRPVMRPDPTARGMYMFWTRQV